MFKVHYGISIRPGVILDAYGTGSTVEDPRSLIDEQGHTFSAGDWKVEFGGRNLSFLRVSFTDGEKTLLRRVYSNFAGTLLLGTNDGRLSVEVLRNNESNFLTRKFGITAYYRTDPNTDVTTHWRDPNIYDDWQIALIVTNGSITHSVDDDDLSGYCGDRTSTISDASWTVICQESYNPSSGTIKRRISLHSEKNPFEIQQELEDWLNEHGLCDFADLLAEWR